MGDLVDIKDRAPNMDMIALLERMLDRAKSGELRSVVMVTVRHDNATGHCWSIDSRTWRQPVLGEFVYVQNELMLKMSADADGGILNLMRE